MNSTNVYVEKSSQYENSLEQLKNAINSSSLEFNFASLDLDSDDRVIAHATPNTLNASESVTIKTHWWGIDIILNEKLTSDIIAGTTATGSVATALAAAFGAAGIITGGVATAIGAALAAVFALKTAELKIVDNGKGVHFPITWPQWGTLLVAAPAGVAGIVAALVVFIHPLRN